MNLAADSIILVHCTSFCCKQQRCPHFTLCFVTDPAAPLRNVLGFHALYLASESVLVKFGKVLKNLCWWTFIFEHVCCLSVKVVCDGIPRRQNVTGPLRSGVYLHQDFRWYALVSEVSKQLFHISLKRTLFLLRSGVIIFQSKSCMFQPIVRGVSVFSLRPVCDGRDASVHLTWLTTHLCSCPLGFDRVPRSYTEDEIESWMYGPRLSFTDNPPNLQACTLNYMCLKVITELL